MKAYIYIYAVPELTARVEEQKLSPEKCVKGTRLWAYRGK